MLRVALLLSLLLAIPAGEPLTEKEEKALSLLSSDAVMKPPKVGRCPVHGDRFSGSGQIIVVLDSKMGIHRYCVDCIVELLDRMLPEVEQPSQ